MAVVKQSYNYVVDSLDLILPGQPNPIKLDVKQISSIYIERDYDNDYFPIIRLSIALEPKVYNQIKTNKLDVKFRLRLQKYLYDNEKKFQFKTDVFNDVFSIFLDDNTPFLDEKLYNKAKETENTTVSPRDFGTEYTFYLFKESDLLNSKKLLNTIISNTNMSNAVAYCLGVSGINKVLMSPLNNNNVYSEVLIPPLTTLGNLLYLEQQYGFYNNGALIFFDIDCLYILDNSPICTAWRPQEYKQTIFTIKETTNANIFTPGSFVDDEQKRFYINVTPSSLNVFTDSVISDQIDGNNLMIITPSTGKVENIKVGAAQRGEGTYKLLINKYGNNFSNNNAKIRKSENSNVVAVNIIDFDIGALTPNKEFIFTFENSQINAALSGSYRICKSIAQLNREGEKFTISGSCEFKKTK